MKIEIMYINLESYLEQRKDKYFIVLITIEILIINSIIVCSINKNLLSSRCPLKKEITNTHKTKKKKHSTKIKSIQSHYFSRQIKGQQGHPQLLVHWNTKRKKEKKESMK